MKSMKVAGSLLAERDKIQALITNGEATVKQAEAASGAALEKAGAIAATAALDGGTAGDDGQAREEWREAKERVELASARGRGLKQKLAGNTEALAGVEPGLTREVAEAEDGIIEKLKREYNQTADSFRKAALQLAAAVHVCRRQGLGEWLGKVNVPDLETGVKLFEISNWPANPSAAKIERDLKPAREVLEAVEKLTTDAAFNRKQRERAEAERRYQAQRKQQPTATVMIPSTPAVPPAAKADAVRTSPVPSASEVQQQARGGGMVFDARPQSK